MPAVSVLSVLSRSPALSARPAQLRCALSPAAVGVAPLPRSELRTPLGAVPGVGRYKERPGPKRCGAVRCGNKGRKQRSARRCPTPAGARDLAALRPLPAAASFGPRFPRDAARPPAARLRRSVPPGSGRTAARPAPSPLRRRPALPSPPPPTEARVPLKARGGCAGRFMNGAT